MAQPAFALPDPPSEYAIGVKRASGPEWVGVARGFDNAFTAMMTARAQLGGELLTAPISTLSYTDRAIARQGRVVEARG